MGHKGAYSSTGLPPIFRHENNNIHVIISIPENFMSAQLVNLYFSIFRWWIWMCFCEEMPRVSTGPRTSMSSKLPGELTRERELRPFRRKGVDTLWEDGVAGYMGTFEGIFKNLYLFSFDWLLYNFDLISFFEGWSLLLSFRGCSVGAGPYFDELLMYLWGGRRSPRLPPPLSSSTLWGDVVNQPYCLV